MSDVAYPIRLRWERFRLAVSENIIRFGQWVGRMSAEHPAAQDRDLIREAKDRIARVVVALQDGSRPALERLAHEALDLLNQVEA